MTKRTSLKAASFRLVLAVAAACASAGCTAVAAGVGGPQPAGGAAGRRDPARPPAARQARAPVPAVVIVRHVVLADGHLMTVARFSGGVRFVLHCGSVDPGVPGVRGLRAGPAVGSSARRLLVAAFNGGFKLSAGVGGYEQQGTIISPLVPGRASLVIYRSGAASIGVWHHGVPRPGRPVYSVRQNLGLLVAAGHPTPASSDWQAWGATITGGEYVARSAIGQNARGQLIYVAGMSASPADLAAALVQFGARIGMQLDINPEWVQLAYARTPGGHLVKGVIGQARPADQYLVGWTRDFIAVLATWVPAKAPGAHFVR